MGSLVFLTPIPPTGSVPFLPPVPPYWANGNISPHISSNPPNSAERSDFSPTIIGIIGCLGAAFLVVSYYTMFAKFCKSRRVSRRGRRDEDSDEAGEQNEAVWPMLTQGLDEAVIHAIPICKYSKSEGLVDGSECAVCLSEFDEEDFLRLLPKCNHAFHLPCIDKWLQSHSNCPLCRANIVSSAPRLAPPTPAPEIAVVTAGEDNAAHISQPLQEAGSSAHVQNSSDQRISEPTADDDLSPNARRCAPFPRNGDQSTPREETEVEMEERRKLKALNRNSKIYSRFTAGLQIVSEQRLIGRGFRCFSNGRALVGLEERRMQDVYQECGRGALPIRRSCSLGSYSRSGDGLDPFHGNQTGSVYLSQEAEAEAPRLLRSNSSVKLNIDLKNGTGSSSNHVSPRDFKSRSLNQDKDLKSKAEMHDPVAGRMLLSLNKGPLAVKRSFSGGRLFGFRVKNMVGTANATLPI